MTWPSRNMVSEDVDFLELLFPAQSLSLKTSKQMFLLLSYGAEVK